MLVELCKFFFPFLLIVIFALLTIVFQIGRKIRPFTHKKNIYIQKKIEEINILFE